MSEEKSQIQQMKPYILAAGVLLVVLVVLLFWPASEDPIQSQPVPVPTTELDASPAQELVEQAQNALDEAEVFEPPQAPTEVVIGEEEAQVEVLEPVIETGETLVEEVQELDISDEAVKAALVTTIRSPRIADLLVDEALLQKFVINVNDLANEEITLKDNILTPPARGFDVYNQADKMWIDRSSFQRYTPYVDAIETVDTDELIALYERYKPTLTEKFSEISRPNEELDSSLIRAIDELLDTPQVPVPIEVYSDSVMYKFADPQLEALSGPQKQMIRMGPDNMRRMKEVLRDLKSELESRS